MRNATNGNDIFWDYNYHSVRINNWYSNYD